MKVLKKVLGYASILDFYELKENLGKGKFGLVKKAIHKKTKKEVAIKIMKKSTMTPLDYELVNKEIEVMKMCQHPNLVRLLDLFENFKHIYLVMELCQGGDLFAYLEKRKFRLPEARAASIIHSLAAALYYLHKYGIIHRDIKPENILMVDKSESSDVKIVDFGLATMIGPSQTCSESFGTLAYVAPEVLQKQPYGKQVDVWCLGILAFLMMVGALPFDHEDDYEVAKLTIKCEPNYSSSAWKNITKEGMEFVKKILVKNPEHRLALEDVLTHPWITRDVQEIRLARCNSLPGDSFELFSLACPNSPDLFKKFVHTKQLTYTIHYI